MSKTAHEKCDHPATFVTVVTHVWEADLEHCTRGALDAPYRSATHILARLFSAASNEKYVSKNRAGFESYFISLAHGPTIELMALPELADAPANPECVGWAHIAIAVGNVEQVDKMAQKPISRDDWQARPVGQATGSMKR